jgi:hypothetical protein
MLKFTFAHVGRKDRLFRVCGDDEERDSRCRANEQEEARRSPIVKHQVCNVYRSLKQANLYIYPQMQWSYFCELVHGWLCTLCY